MRESNKATQAFEDYFSLGPGRSLDKLLEQYRVQSGNKASTPTLRKATLAKWSSSFGWQQRVAERDAEIAQAAFEKVKEQATETGYAVWQKRIADLNSLAALLFEEISDVDKRWLPDVKQIGSGESFERVDIVRFNSALIEQFRQALGDIASEMGERVKGIKIEGKEGAPVGFTLDLLKMDEDELKQFIANIREALGSSDA